MSPNKINYMELTKLSTRQYKLPKEHYFTFVMLFGKIHEFIPLKIEQLNNIHPNTKNNGITVKAHSVSQLEFFYNRAIKIYS